MQVKVNVITLQSIAGGAAAERFSDALQDLLVNVQDPNTEPDAKRSIRLEFEFTPNEERTRMDVTIKCSKKLAAPRPVKTYGYISEEGGKPVATEYNPAQGNLFVAEKKETMQ